MFTSWRCIGSHISNVGSAMRAFIGNMAFFFVFVTIMLITVPTLVQGKKVRNANVLFSDLLN